VNKQPIQLQLKDLENKDYVYPNTQTKGKVTLIQIMGTWCPNCLDESRYLASLKAQYKDQLEIIAITYETQESVEDRIAKVKKYKESLDLNFTFLMGGKACKTCAAELFPMFNAITSFPTLIFINKKGEIKNIHTGFSGPGTGIYYEKFVDKTNLFIEQLIKE
jgi:thiol-disulfide isomerase/thioredoxin